MTTAPCGNVDSGHVHTPLSLPDIPSPEHTYIHAGQSTASVETIEGESEGCVDTSTLSTSPIGLDDDSDDDLEADIQRLIAIRRARRNGAQPDATP